MAVITLDECKEILGISDNTKDTKIEALIPYVERDICSYCNNYFSDTTIYVDDPSGALVFARGSTLTSSTSPDTITDGQDRFITSGFRVGMDIVVFAGSNEGIYNIAGVSTDVLTLDSTGELESIDPSASYNIVGPNRIARIKWPRELKLYAAKMIGYLIDKPKESDARSESIDDYSITYAVDNAYPERIIKGLSKYRRAILI